MFLFFLIRCKVTKISPFHQILTQKLVLQPSSLFPLPSSLKMLTITTFLDITLAELEDAIADALGSNGTATIKSSSGGFVTYTNGFWRPANMPFDIREMYKIQISADCEITLTGVAVDPAEYPITIHYGNNWVGCLTGESISVTEAFAGLVPEIGDVVKSKTGSATYYSTGWRGQLQTLEPGQGYMYQSKATEDKTFVFPASN